MLRFEAFWASLHSFLYPDDKQHNPWYLDLGRLYNFLEKFNFETVRSTGDINSGAAGFIGGPNVVTVMGADFCVEGADNYVKQYFSG